MELTSRTFPSIHWAWARAPRLVGTVTLWLPPPPFFRLTQVYCERLGPGQFPPFPKPSFILMSWLNTVAAPPPTSNPHPHPHPLSLR